MIPGWIDKRMNVLDAMIKGAKDGEGATIRMYVDNYLVECTITHSMDILNLLHLEKNELMATKFQLEHDEN